MRLTAYQLEILRFVNSQGGQATKAEIVERFAYRYYRTEIARRYVGQALARLVRRGVLYRPKRGLYITGPGAYHIEADPAQLKLSFNSIAL